MGAIAPIRSRSTPATTPRNIVAAAAATSGGRTPSQITVEDLAGYTAKTRDPLCTAYRGKEICGMPPPSSGGIAVAATLGVLEHFAMASTNPTDVDLNGGRPAVMGVHLISEAERLAYADRDRYVADTDFVPLPGGSPDTLLAGDYLAGRAALISDDRTMGTAKPGEFGPPPRRCRRAEHGTSQISVVDAQGNAASLTTTIESAFGSFHMVDGFLLNNQLTDFSAEPVGPDGAAGRQPRAAGQAAAQHDGAHADLRRGRTGLARSALRRHGLAGRVDDHPVRRENRWWGCSTGAWTRSRRCPWSTSAPPTPRKRTSAASTRRSTSPTTATTTRWCRGCAQLGHQVDIADQSSGLSAIVRADTGLGGRCRPAP